MNNWIKRCAVLSAVCFMLMSFAACNGEDGEVKNSPDDKNTPSPTATSELNTESPATTSTPGHTDGITDDLGDAADDLGDAADKTIDGAGDLVEDAGDAVGDAARGTGEVFDDFIPGRNDERNASHLIPDENNNNAGIDMRR